MKLSEAMRLGAAIVPGQAFSQNLDVVYHDVEGVDDMDDMERLEFRACARGDAYIGAHPDINTLEDVESRRLEISGAGWGAICELLDQGAPSEWEIERWHRAKLPEVYTPGPGATPDERDLSDYTGPGREDNLLDLVVILNDTWHWTVPQIADWVESLGF